MAKAPLYTVVNPSKEPKLAAFAGRAEPVDVGRDKALPLSPGEAARLAGEGFNVLDPQGVPVAPPRAPKGEKAA